MKKIITISREFGAGGGTIGQLVAQKLNYDYYDKEIIMEAACHANVDMERMLRYDERVPRNFGFAQSLFNFYNRPLSEKVFQAQKEVIRKIGEKGNCVIIGRNANSILREYDRALHVFVHAPMYYRMLHMKDLMPDTSEEKIMDELQSVDRIRKKYCTFYTDTVFGMSQFYDLSLNTAKFGIDGCADIICELAQM
ncbi:MAG: cytidylate kinase-like family protein [Eubacteriales bacterium]|nr:cytidylate kinase-like family protein [Eubacteriales bacterium]